MTDKISRFSALFDGYTQAYGQYDNELVREPSGKLKGKRQARTIPGPIPAEAWIRHFDNSGPSLGVVMLRDDNTCMFGVIDIDDLQEDHNRRVTQIKQLKLPLVLCRGKSGGSHLYVFLKEPIPAYLLQARLAEWVVALGLPPKTEQFPKQNTRASLDDPGSWINLPYQNGDKTVRYGIDNGKRLTLLEFLDLAEASRVDLQKVEKPFYKQPEKEDDLFWEGPPCLVTITAQGGFPVGTINDGMMAVGTYLKKRFPDDWEGKLREYHRAMGHSPVTDDEEFKTLIKSLHKKEYTYRCKQPPINAACQRRTCLQRRFGIGDTSLAQGLVRILGMTRYEHPAPDPPLWAFEINNKRVMVDNETLYSKDLLNRQILSQANTIPLHMTSARWLRELETLVNEAEIIPMPEEAGPTGQLWERIQMFLDQGVGALKREELVIGGKVWHHEGYAHFRGTDLFEYFDKQRIKYKSEQLVWQLLRDKKASSKDMKINTKVIKVWVLPYERQTENSVKLPMATGEEF